MLNAILDGRDVKLAGLENITKAILAEAESSCAKTKAEFQQKADEMLEAAGKENDEMLANAKKMTDKNYENAILKAESGAQLKKRQAILKAKQAAIESLIEKAYKSVLDMEDDKYFEMLQKMIDKYMEDGKDGSISFSEKDLKRMPSGFEEIIAQSASKKSSRMILKKEPACIDGGFLLEYGGIEENCSIRAILNAKKEVIADKVNHLLFV